MPSTITLIAITAGVAGVLIVGFLLLLISQYKRCPSNKVLVIYGKTGKGQASLSIHGGAKFVWPIVQDFTFLSLEPIQIEIPLRGALSSHAAEGTFALLDTSSFEAPSTRRALEVLGDWSERPTLVVATEDEEVVIKSFRNIQKVLVTVPAELEVVSVVWARSVVVTEAALPLVLARAGKGGEEMAA